MATSASNQGRPYQGYPYTNPIVIDAPSIDAETAARWTNLPRKPLVPNRNPVPDRVYIDIPSNEASRASRNTTISPEESRWNEQSLDRNKENTEENPVIYIDLPENGSSSQTIDERRENSGERNNPAFVEDTIFYDPFEDRRIKVGPNQDTGAGSSISAGRPQRPPAPGSSGSSYLPPRLPPFMSKEASVYGSQSSDDFPLSPIPVSQFPDPPPAYTEVDRPIERPAGPPRTQVIVPEPGSPVGIASSDRKLVSCPHCERRVHTLAVREIGALTHVLALLFLFIFVPLTLLIYCTDYCKYRNHYCPNCNKQIGYEVPILCQDMIYTKNA